MSALRIRPIVIAATLAALTLPSPAHANTYPVANAAELVAAVDASNLNPGPDTINVGPGPYVLSQTLQVRGELEINGPTNGFASVDGGGSLREVIYVTCCSGDLTVSDLEIQNGRTGVLADGIRLRMERTTVSGFSEIGVWDTNGDTVILNSTISFNAIGIYVETGGANPLILRNVTITGNDGFNGGLANFGTTIAYNTIIADNSGGDCGGGSDLDSAGSNNLDSDGSCGPTAITAPPLLGPLQDNGGSTETHAPLPGSPAIDAGTNVGCPATDQRGVLRPQNFVCDMGAVELTPFEFEGADGFVGPGGSLTTDTEGDGATPSDPVETTVTHPDGGNISIREGPGVAAEFGFIGQRVVLDVDPDATPANPLVSVFLIDASVIPPGQSAATIQITKNGIVVPPCTGPGAAPDPCVSSRQTVGDDAELTVLTSDASDWDFTPGSAPPPLTELSIGDVAVIEDDSGMTAAEFRVTLSTPSASTVTVDFATANGTATAPADYLSNAGTVTFVPGDTEELVAVQVNGDTLVEPDESFSVTLSDPVGASIADGHGEGTILDDDLPADFDARVQGNGSIGPGHNQRTFKAQARFTNGMPNGKATYVDKLVSPTLKFQSTSFTSLSCVGTLATIHPRPSPPTSP